MQAAIPHRSSSRASSTRIFAILFSSFSELLLLDADDFPFHNVIELFEYEPFTSTGLVTWPDFWEASISPAYYLISSQPVVPVSERASTESGQLPVSKQKNWPTLLLAAYYNYYGPTHYYTLLNQGGAGRGDKSTFLPAASALNLAFYHIKQPIVAVGHQSAGGWDNFWRMGLIQHDPIEDYQLYSDRNTTLTPDEARSSDVTARAYFLHMTDPKWDAAEAFHHDGGFDLTQDDTGARAPAFRDPPEARDEIEGVERMVWEEMRLVGCELEFVTGHWREKEGVCERLERYFEEVLDTELGSEMGLGPLEEGLWPAG